MTVARRSGNDDGHHLGAVHHPRSRSLASRSPRRDSAGTARTATQLLVCVGVIVLLCGAAGKSGLVPSNAPLVPLQTRTATLESP